MMQVMKPQCVTPPEVRALEGRDSDDERCNVMYVTSLAGMALFIDAS